MSVLIDRRSSSQVVNDPILTIYVGQAFTPERDSEILCEPPSVGLRLIFAHEWAPNLFLTLQPRRKRLGYRKLHARVTTTSSPRVLTLYSSNGRGGGPPMFFPLKLYCPLWHAHQICFVSSRYCTMHSRCVHTAEKALNSPVAV